jgi:hypothetical protein
VEKKLEAGPTCCVGKLTRHRNGIYPWGEVILDARGFGTLSVTVFWGLRVELRFPSEGYRHASSGEHAQQACSAFALASHATSHGGWGISCILPRCDWMGCHTA